MMGHPLAGLTSRAAIGRRIVALLLGVALGFLGGGAAALRVL